MKVYFETDKGKLYCGNALDVLKELPDESVDLVITSPPYWAKRDYGESAFTILGGDPDCDHEWVEQEVGLQHENRNNVRGRQEEVVGKKGTVWIRKYNKRKALVCRKCGAWFGQLGLEPTPQMFVEHLVEIFREVKRVLKPTGSLFVNIDDTWVGGGAWNGGGGRKYKDGEWERGWVGNATFPSPTTFFKGAKRKSLALVPELFAVKMVYGEGWILREKIVWAKKVWLYKDKTTKGNAMPESVKDRLSHGWEYILHFTKRPKYYFNLDAVRVPLKRETMTRLPTVEARKNVNKERAGERSEEVVRVARGRSSSSKYLGENAKNTRSPGGRLVKIVAEGEESQVALVREAITNVNAYLKRKLKERRLSVRRLSQITGIKETQLAHYFRTDLSGALLPSREVWNILQPILGLDEYEEHVKEEYRSVIPSSRPRGANPGDVVQINVRPFKDAHFAVYPPEIPEVLIKVASPEDGVVLDPFAGAGTTLVVAEKLGREWIGIEINPDYCEIIRNRFKKEGLI